MHARIFQHDPVVITGIGMITSVGNDRESVWRAIQHGENGVKVVPGFLGLPDGEFRAATVDIRNSPTNRLKVFPMSEAAADEAIRDADVDLESVDLERFGCAMGAHMGDCSWLDEHFGFKQPDAPHLARWYNQFLPCTSGTNIANRYGLAGPRTTYSTACASSLISILSAERMIIDGQADIVLAGGAEAVDRLTAASFRRMGVLAQDGACRPYDRNRKGFVLGEGAAMFVLERLSHALHRGARIYAEIGACKSLTESYHITSLSDDCDALSYLISSTIEAAGLESSDVGYINSHGTGTKQNDLAEMRGIRQALGPAADHVCVSSNKSALGHMINAAGGVELAITVLALRDGFAPPTLNLTDPDPECTFDCLPMIGRRNRFQHALKLSVAFGGHLVAVALNRWNAAASGYGYPVEPATEVARAA